MDHIAKQDRSRKRIEIILETAEKILLEDGIDQVTIANISNRSGLKRTSTYKFFQTPEAIKSMLISNYLNMCCLLYTSPSPRDISGSRMPSSA